MRFGLLATPTASGAGAATPAGASSLAPAGVAGTGVRRRATSAGPTMTSAMPTPMRRVTVSSRKSTAMSTDTKADEPITGATLFAPIAAMARKLQYRPARMCTSPPATKNP